MSQDERGQVTWERCAKRVRVVLGGVVIADSTETLMVWEIPPYPAYYLPSADVRAGVLRPIDRTDRSPSRGDARYFDVVSGRATAPAAAWAYPESPIPVLRDRIRFDFAAMDAWFEEDEQIFVHPRDPHRRVDILASSRHIRVELNGTTVAESRSPRLLFETGLPTRYYLPLLHARQELFRPSTTKSQCPYKGEAHYWSVEVGGELVEDVVWSYRTPILEAVKIAGLIAFYNERVDLYVDDVPQQRPTNRFG